MPTQVQHGVRMQEIDADSAGQRVDNYLLRELKGTPKSRIYRILRRGEVRVNKSRVKPDYKLQAGDVLRIPPVRLEEGAKPKVPGGIGQRLEKAVLYEDDGLLIVNKPSGLAVHGGSGLNFGLIEAMRQTRPEQRFLELVHRLDRDTSGCVMLAKKRSVLRQLHELLRSGKIDKRYYALVEGKWPVRKRLVNQPLEKNVLKSGERMVSVSLEGKASRTEYEMLERFPHPVLPASLVEAKPITGRTHQIRVHCQAAGYPILGDDKYGREDANRAAKELGLKRLFLHAHALDFRLDGRRIKVSAPMGPELESILAVLRDLELVKESGAEPGKEGESCS